MDMSNRLQSGYSNEAVRQNIVVAFGTNDLHVILGNQRLYNGNSDNIFLVTMTALTHKPGSGTNCPL